MAFDVIHIETNPLQSREPNHKAHVLHRTASNLLSPNIISQMWSIHFLTDKNNFELTSNWAQLEGVVNLEWRNQVALVEIEKPARWSPPK